MPRLARAAGGRARADGQPRRLAVDPRGAGARQRAHTRLRREHQPRRRGDDRALRGRVELRYRGRARRGRRADRVRGGASSLRHRRPAAAVPRRPLAALAPQLPDDPRHARPPHAAAPGAASRATAARPLPARRAARPSRCRPTGSWARSCSCGARCSSELGGLDEGYHLYGEDIDLAYRARAGRLGALVRARRGRRPPPPGR